MESRIRRISQEQPERPKSRPVRSTKIPYLEDAPRQERTWTVAGAGEHGLVYGVHASSPPSQARNLAAISMCRSVHITSGAHAALHYSLLTSCSMRDSLR